MTLLLLFLIGVATAGEDCERLERIQREVQKHGESFVAATRNDTDEEFQEYLDRKHLECKREIEQENEPPVYEPVDDSPSDE